MNLDPRLNAFRPDLADEMLRGRVAAERFVPGELFEIAEPILPLHSAPRFDAPRATELLFGERVKVFVNEEGWAWVKAANDGYVGYVPASGLSREITSSGHRVFVPMTFMYPAADLKSTPEAPLPMNSRVEIVETGEKFVRLRNGRHVIAGHLKPLSRHEEDFVAVAELYLHVPYLWGGKTFHGIDCSGLIQTALHAAGFPCPRDTDLQEQVLGSPLHDHGALRRGDLLFWKNHAGIMVDDENLLHANAYYMDVTREPVSRVITRIAIGGGQLQSVKRLQ
ncbi:MAG TPA: NlpC/P60 family protein [Aestuariivirgaceae bacterium]|jgi:cell wall-associated NlpC family hydrolase